MALKIGSTSVSKMYKGSVEITKGYLGSTLIYSSVLPTVALNNSNFSTARDLWFTDQAQAETTYGLIENWNTTAVTNMNAAFKGNAGVIRNDFNEDIGNWDVSNVTDMSDMLRTQPLFNQDIGSWDTSKVSKFVFMFYFSTAFNQDISGWDITGAWNMFGMLEGVVNYNHSFAGWDVSTIQANSRLLNPTNNYSMENYDSTLIGWEASLQAAYPNGVGYTFSPAPTFGNAKYTGLGAGGAARASLVNTFNWTFTDGGDVAALTNSSFITARDLWFTNQTQAEATYGLIGDWNTTGVTSMNNAFKVANNVTNGFNEDISGWDTSNVTSTYAMFFDQTSFNQPIGSWDVSSVTAASNMFRSCESFNQPLNSWNTSSFADINSLFFRCLVFNQPLNSWDTSNVTNLATTFYGAFDFNQDLSSWNTGSVTSLFYTFRTASSFNQNLGSWDITNVSTLSNIFKDTALDTSNYDLMLIAWESSLQTQFPNGAGYLKIPAADFGSTKYTGGGSAATARASLVSNFNWTITDGGIA
jgi:surface protein